MSDLEGNFISGLLFHEHLKHKQKPYYNEHVTKKEFNFYQYFHFTFI